jgi:c-di-GMP-binding flagellar brake protein YcgR
MKFVSAAYGSSDVSKTDDYAIGSRNRKMINLRRFERIQFFCDVSLTVLPDGPTVEAHCVDISLGGVGLVTLAALGLGQTVALAFSLRDEAGKTVVNRVMGRVVHLRADPDANRVGVEFLEILSPSASPQLSKKVLKD